MEKSEEQGNCYEGIAIKGSYLPFRELGVLFGPQLFQWL